MTVEKPNDGDITIGMIEVQPMAPSRVIAMTTNVFAMVRVSWVIGIATGRVKEANDERRGRAERSKGEGVPPLSRRVAASACGGHENHALSPTP